MTQHAHIASAALRGDLPIFESLIGMFSPPPPVRTGSAMSQVDHRALWSADAMHRARNLAQLAAAVAHFGARAPYLGQIDAAADVGALAAAYAELGHETAGSDPVPCADLLTRIVSGLVLLFGNGAHQIVLRCAVDQLMLPCERRRALVLIASELVVNALKYGFPERGGTIAVSLTVAASHAELIVEDDGAGLAPGAKAGGGSRILDQMAMLLHAPVARATPSGGGLRVSLAVPLTAA